MVFGGETFYHLMHGNLSYGISPFFPEKKKKPKRQNSNGNGCKAINRNRYSRPEERGKNSRAKILYYLCSNINVKTDNHFVSFSFQTCVIYTDNEAPAQRLTLLWIPARKLKCRQAIQSPDRNYFEWVFTWTMNFKAQNILATQTHSTCTRCVCVCVRDCS